MEFFLGLMGKYGNSTTSPYPIIGWGGIYSGLTRVV